MEFVRAHMIFKSVLALVDASDAKITTTFIMEYAKKCIFYARITTSSRRIFVTYKIGVLWSDIGLPIRYSMERR